MGPAPLYKRFQEAKPSGVQSLHPTAKAHAAVDKASLGRNRVPVEKRRQQTTCAMICTNTVTRIAANSQVFLSTCDLCMAVKPFPTVGSIQI